MTSYRLVLRLKQLRGYNSQGIKLYKTINSGKSILLEFSVMVSKSYHAENVLENTYFVFYMFYNAFQKLLPVDATNKKVY